VVDLQGGGNSSSQPALPDAEATRLGLLYNATTSTPQRTIAQDRGRPTGWRGQHSTSTRPGGLGRGLYIMLPLVHHRSLARAPGTRGPVLSCPVLSRIAEGDPIQKWLWSGVPADIRPPSSGSPRSSDGPLVYPIVAPPQGSTCRPSSLDRPVRVHRDQIRPGVAVRQVVSCTRRPCIGSRRPLRFKV
jgi:hypothetical protein